jgi:hypothetical protein
VYSIFILFSWGHSVCCRRIQSGKLCSHQKCSWDAITCFFADCFYLMYGFTRFALHCIALDWTVPDGASHVDVFCRQCGPFPPDRVPGIREPLHQRGAVHHHSRGIGHGEVGRLCEASQQCFLRTVSQLPHVF